MIERRESCYNGFGFDLHDIWEEQSFFREEKKKRRESVVRAGGCPYVADPREKGRKEEQIEGEERNECEGKSS